MHRLILLVIRPRPADAGQDVKRNLSVGFRIFNFGTLVRHLRCCVVGATMFESPRHFSTEYVRFQARVENSSIKAERGVERRTHIADLFEFGPDAA